MFRHAVLIDFVPKVGSAEIDEIAAKVNGLPARIPVVVAAVCGRDATVTAGSSDFAIVVDLANSTDYPEYIAHAAHQELVELLGPRVRNRSVVDFEV